MNKLLAVGLVSLAAFSLSASSSDAGLLSHWRCSHCSTYSATICVRPYNAFSPVCFGNIQVQGCHPFAFGCGFSCMPPCGPSDCCGAGCLPPHTGPGPAQDKQPGPAPGTGSPSFTPPMPTPVPSTSGMGQYPSAYPGHGVVQPAGYQPFPQSYYPGYFPGYMPTTPSPATVPSYWYGR